jgi:hypothetical protein
MENNNKKKSSKNIMVRHELGFSCLGYRHVAGTCECGNELPGLIKC